MLKKTLSIILALSIIVGLLTMLPTNAATSSDVPSDAVEFNGHFYKVFDESISWSNAKSYCESIGGHLVTINSQEEQDFLIAEANSKSKRNYWIGAYPENGNFHWVTGEDFSYTNWASGEPNNVFNMQNAVMMYTKRASYPAGTWNDENENGRNWSGYELSTIGYICEWDGGSLNKLRCGIEDTYSFKNLHDRIPLSFYNMVFDSSRANALYNENESEGHGLCFGMVDTAMATSIHRFPNINSYGTFRTTVNSLSNTDYSLTTGLSVYDYIRYGYILQFTDVMARELESNIVINTHNDLQSLVDKIKSYSSYTYEPILIAVYGEYKGEMAGHALWPLGIGKNDSSVTEVIVYDCNHPNTTRTLYLYKNNNRYTRWEYELFDGSLTFNSERNLARISYCTPADDLCSLFSSQNLTYSCNYKYLITSRNNNAMYVNDNGNKRLSEYNNSEQVLRVIPLSITDNNFSSPYLYWSNLDDRIVFDADDSVTTHSVSSQDGSVRITTNSASTASVALSNLDFGTVLIESSNSNDFEIVYSSAGDSNELSSVSITGVGQEKVETVQTDGGVILSGAENIIVMMDDNTAGKAALYDLDSQNSTIISNENGSTVVKQDIDNDGTYDTVITPTFIKGDADGDRVVTILDATIIQRKLASYYVANPEIVDHNGDAMGDGLDIIDATCIQRFLADYENIYNIGSKIE